MSPACSPKFPGYSADVADIDQPHERERRRLKIIIPTFSKRPKEQ